VKILTTDTERHRDTLREYDDETLELISVSIAAEPGWQLNGHRADCRCTTCRPDIVRLP
jgi:hypothetical protein